MDLKITTKGSETEVKRNIQILAMVADGFTSIDIGKELGLSHRTIETYIDKMIFANDCRNRVHLIFKASKDGII